jgi:anti-sigma regulatory factor (Ser/Thr protein kinase)
MEKPPDRSGASTSPDLVLELSATTTGLRSCLDRIRESCTRSKLPRDTASRLQIVVEELFSNTIKYGYGGECERPVRLRLRCSPGIELVYEDLAPPFDPTAWRETEPPGAAPPGDGLGRKGIVLVLGLAQSARYERLREGNRLTLRFA